MSYYLGEIFRLRNEFSNAYNAGKYIKAILAGEKVKQIYEENNDNRRMEYAEDIHNLAVAYDEVGNYDTAIKLYKESAEIKKKMSPNSLSFVDTLNNLAVDYSMTNDYEKAIEMHKAVLKLRSDLLGEDHIDTINSLYNLGNAYQDIKDYMTSLGLLGSASVRMENYRNQYKDLYADILVCIGRCYEKMGEYSKSLMKYVEAIKIIEKSERAKSFYFISTLLEASELCVKFHRYDWAALYGEDAVSIRGELMSRTHLDYVTGLNTLADIYIKQGEYKKALETHKEELEILEKILYDKHPFYADCIDSIGNDYRLMGEYDKAMENFDKALALKEEVVGKKSMPYANTIINIAKLYKDKEEYVEAIEKLTETTGLCAAFGEDNPVYFEAVTTMAEICPIIGKYAEAEKIYDRTYDIEIKSNKKNAERLIKISKGLNAIGKTTKALRVARDAALIYQSEYDDKHPKYAEAIYLMGEIQFNAKKYAKACEYFKQSTYIWEHTITAESELLRKSIKSLAEAYYKKGDYFHSAAMYKKLVDLRKELREGKKFESACETIMMALCYYRSRDFDKGNSCYKNAMDILKENNLSKDGFIGQRCGEIAEIMLKAKRFDEAADFASESIETLKSIYGERNGKLAVGAYVLAHTYSARGNDDKALGFLKNSVDIFEKSDDYKCCSEAFFLMGALFEKKGQFENAIDAYLKTEKIAEGGLYVNTLVKLGGMFYTQREYKRAKSKFANLKTYIEEYGDANSYEYAFALEHLGLISKKESEYDKAAAFLEKAVKLYSYIGTKDITHYTDLVLRLAKLFEVDGKTTEAIKYYKICSRIIKRKDGENAKYAKVLLRAARIYCEQGDMSTSSSLLFKASKILQADGGELYERVVLKLADVSYKAGQRERALSAYKEIRDFSRERGKASLFTPQRRERLKELEKKSRKLNKLFGFI